MAENDCGMVIVCDIIIFERRKPMDIKEWTIEEKVGQMIMIGMDSNYITDRIREMILTYKIGGIILYRKNFDTYEALLTLIKELKQLNAPNRLPLFIAIDQEGGRVNRMPKEFNHLINAKEIAETKDIALVKESGNIIGEMLHDTGFNMDFAPVLDIQRFPDQHAIGNRCYGKNAADVSLYGVAVMKQLQQQNVVSVIKHFPGHGITKTDSHYLFPSIKSIHEVEKEDMKPFETAMVQAGADAVMVSHMMIQDVSKIYPASLSRKFICQYIRKQYHYRGLIITDDLKMRSIRYIYGPKLAVRKAFEAGNDIILFRFGKMEEKNVIQNVIKLVKRGAIKESRINRSVMRIMKTKEKYHIKDEVIPTGCDIANINTRIDQIELKVRGKS